ncbi:MAG: DNA polymerase III subunit gamma/tau [Acholeplasmatales bacterium]|jgi:DNA polymerase-3 subunit gamma/tau|nr:DNA polymerase III subunit gamma/tau [Acholeplasmatales bacterium]
MTYQALYRTYRPRTFSDVVGQDVIVQTLKNAIINNKIAHAYLFSGPRGTGKTSVAKIFANAVNCEAEASKVPCGECETCKAILEDAVSDVIEIDAASNNGVDEIRELRDKVKYMPAQGKYKVYIIDEVHMLTIQAFNALLKTLEEPPAHVIFILATTEANKIPLTILSRCQRFDFRGITITNIVDRLKIIIETEKIDIEKEAVLEIARQADGSMRDAISLLDQVYSFSEGSIKVDAVYDVSGSVRRDVLLELITDLLNKDVSSAFKVLNTMIEDGKEIGKIVSDLISLLRDALIVKNVSVENEDENSELQQFAKSISNDRIYFYLDVLNETQNDIKWTTQKRAYLELALVKMIDHQTIDRINANEKLEMLVSRINQLERDLNNISIQEIKVIKQEEIKNSTKEVKEPKEKDPLKKAVTVKEIEDILNNGDKKKKEELLKIWPRLKDVKDPEKEIIAKSLSNSEVVASTKDTAILVYPDKALCNMMLNENYKKAALGLLNGKTKYLEDYICLDSKTWEELLKEFTDQWNNNIKKPKLKERNLNIYEAKVEKWEAEIVKQARHFFGDDKIKVEE